MTLPVSPENASGAARVRGILAAAIDFAATEARGLAGRVMPPAPLPEGPAVDVLDDAEGLEIFEMAAQANLGISAAEFMRRHDDGEYDDVDDPTIARVAILLPLGR